MNIVDSASLTFFSNPQYFSILERKKLCNQRDNLEEVKFYRKRIITLFKDMLKESSEYKEIKEIHTMFVNAAIRYFEIIDKKDIIQGQHQANADADADANADADADADLDKLFSEEITNMDEANDLMMRKTIAVSNLDNYIITKQDASTNDLRIIPLKMEINLKTQDLKIKGVPPKKIKKKKEDLSN